MFVLWPSRNALRSRRMVFRPGSKGDPVMACTGLAENLTGEMETWTLQQQRGQMGVSVLGCDDDEDEIDKEEDVDEEESARMEHRI